MFDNFIFAGAWEDCVNGKCLLQQNNDGQVVSATDGCGDCDSKIAHSVCSREDKCQCPQGMSLFGGVRCGDSTAPPGISKDDSNYFISSVR